VPGDFDGDGRADLAVYLPKTATWQFWYSKSDTQSTVVFGLPQQDRFLLGDFDGDLKADMAVYRASTSTFIYRRSSDHVDVQIPFATANDIPVPGDYDGDGYTDIAIFRPATAQWAILQSSTGTIQVLVHAPVGPFKVVPADYDGDGKTDPAYYRPDTRGFYILQSSNQQLRVIRNAALIGLPFAGDFTDTNQSSPATYDPDTGMVTIITPAGDIRQRRVNSHQRPVCGNTSADVGDEFATFNVQAANWIIHFEMAAPVPPPFVLSANFGTPGESIPLLAIPSSLSSPLVP